MRRRPRPERLSAWRHELVPQADGCGSLERCDVRRAIGVLTGLAMLLAFAEG
jgi:hypothetical protein